MTTPAVETAAKLAPEMALKIRKLEDAAIANRIKAIRRALKIRVERQVDITFEVGVLTDECDALLEEAARRLLAQRAGKNGDSE